MPVARDSVTGQWTSGRGRQTGDENTQMSEADVADQREGLRPNLLDPQSRNAVATGPSVNDVSAGQTTGRMENLAARVDSPGAGSDGRLDVPSSNVTGLGTIPSSINIGSSHTSSDDPTVWTHVLKRRRSASPVLMGRSPRIKTENSFTVLQDLEPDENPVTGYGVTIETISDEGTDERSSEGPVITPRTRRAIKGKDVDWSGLAGTSNNGTPRHNINLVSEYTNLGELDPAELNVHRQQAELDRYQSMAHLSNTAEAGMSKRYPGMGTPISIDGDIERARQSREQFIAKAEARVREAWNATASAERAKTDAEEARARAEKRLGELTSKMDRIIGAYEAQTERLSSLERQYIDMERVNPYRGSGIREPGRYWTGSTGPNHPEVPRTPAYNSPHVVPDGPVFTSASAFIPGGRSYISTAAPPSGSIPGSSSLGHTISRKMKQLNEAMNALQARTRG
jgi:hypothetical protein